MLKDTPEKDASLAQPNQGMLQLNFSNFLQLNIKNALHVNFN
jgi:hypothetical protein